MTPIELKAELEKKYQIIGFVDLGELTQSPTSAFKFLEPLYQEYYNNNDRIVIFSSQTNISKSLIGHLYRTANFLDISNWFVLWCTPNNIESLLQEACDEFSDDRVAFQHASYNLKKTKPLLKNYNLPDTICAIPWSNLEIKPSGNISPCCVYFGSFGNINQDTLLNVFHSTGMNQLRDDLANGKKPIGCNSCWEKENQGLVSMRQHNIKRLKKSFLKEHFDQPSVTYLDIKFQNTCNFKCRICNPNSSSLFAKEHSKFKKIKITPQSNWSTSESFLTQINELLPKIKNIDMYGGEPFLIKKFSTILKTAIKKDYAKNIRLHYNSNGSIWPDAFIEYWKLFQQVDIHFSIDAIGQQFELQRGGNWKDVENNILRIKNLKYPNMSISIMPTISIMNVYYIDQVFDWANQHNFQVFVNYVNEPDAYSLSEITTEAKNIILEKHKNNPWPEMQKIIKMLESIPGRDGHNFCKKTEWFDSIRQENFAKTHPEIAKAMGYVYNKHL